MRMFPTIYKNSWQLCLQTKIITLSYIILHAPRHTHSYMCMYECVCMYVMCIYLFIYTHTNAYIWTFKLTSSKPEWINHMNNMNNTFLSSINTCSCPESNRSVSGNNYLHELKFSSWHKNIQLLHSLSQLQKICAKFYLVLILMM